MQFDMQTQSRESRLQGQLGTTPQRLSRNTESQRVPSCLPQAAAPLGGRRGRQRGRGPAPGPAAAARVAAGPPRRRGRGRGPAQHPGCRRLPARPVTEVMKRGAEAEIVLEWLER